MNRQEINEFIEKMEEVCDVWTEEQVNDVYGASVEYSTGVFVFSNFYAFFKKKD